MHISGAETLCAKRMIKRMAQAFVDRALTHPRGMPDRIVLTIEEMTMPVNKASMLPFEQVDCLHPDDAKAIANRYLESIGSSAKAIGTAWRILTADRQMRGAALLDAKSGFRREPDRQRGVRASRLGMGGADCRIFTDQLESAALNTGTVREAMMLAAKVAAHPDVLAELCISDDPDYTTGYVASKTYGYIRLPNIKETGSHHGGRVFFIRPGADIPDIISFLEQTPVLLTISRKNRTKGAGISA
jgi:6-carboxyhexanoate--CoA ligase